MDQTVRGHQPAGPKRWMRAAQWAAEKPHTKAGQTYLARTAAATMISTTEGEKPWLHFRAGTYQYQTCSTYCAMLQLQLDLSCAGLEELHARVLAGGDDRFTISPRPADSKRRGKCKVCGENVV